MHKTYKAEHLQHTIDKFTEVAISQEKKGLEKYGQYLDPKDLKYDWLGMAMEEGVDLIKYLHAEQKKRKFIVCKILRILEKLDISEIVSIELRFWLDALEGAIDEGNVNIHTGTIKTNHIKDGDANARI